MIDDVMNPSRAIYIVDYLTIFPDKLADEEGQ